MASKYPGELDSLPTNETNSTPAENVHPALHNDANAAINKIEEVLGLNVAGGNATVVERLSLIEGRISSAITPEAHGAKADLKYVTDAAITINTKVLTSATANFTNADVGKTISIRGPGLNTNKNVLTTTIASVTNTTTAVLTAEAAVTVSGKVAIYGTDDTTAIREAINEAVTNGINAKTYYGEVRLRGRYMVAGTPIKGGETKGNAQIPIPAILPTSQMKFRLVLSCPGGRGAPLIHWHQTHPQMSGATLFSPLVAAAQDGEWSVPCVIGGPTVLPEDETTEGFSNMLLEVTGSLTILMPRHANHIGMDLGKIAQADIDSLAVLANATASELLGDAASNEYSNNGEGLRMPRLNNNDLSRIGSYSVEGMTYGAGIADHFQADRIAAIYCKYGLFVGPIGSRAYHGMNVNYFSFEGGTHVMEIAGNAGGKYPVTIARLDVEDGGGVGTDFVDSESCFRGTVNYANNESRAPTKTGATHLKVTDNNNTA